MTDRPQIECFHIGWAQVIRRLRRLGRPVGFLVRTTLVAHCHPIVRLETVGWTEAVDRKTGNWSEQRFAFALAVRLVCLLFEQGVGFGWADV